jgi:hypothetical protein
MVIVAIVLAIACVNVANCFSRGCCTRRRIAMRLDWREPMAARGNCSPVRSSRLAVA